MKAEEFPFKPELLEIMVVDDHDLMRKSIAKVLAKRGFGSIIECASGREAKKILKSRNVHLLICDIYLGDSDGFDIVRHVRDRETQSDIPVIIVTGEAGKDEIVRAADVGAEDYMLKPFQAEDLDKKVMNLLTQYYSPTPFVSLVRQSEECLRTENFADALEKVEEALRLDPLSARGAHLRAIVLDKLGRSGEAIQVIQDSISRNPSYYRSYMTLANIYLRNQNEPQAIGALQSELALNPKQASRQALLAKLLLQSGDARGAIEHYRLALLEDGKMKAALLGMGRAYAEMDNLEKAIYYFKRMRRHHPDDSMPLEAIVKVSLAAHKPKAAEMSLRDEKKSFPKRLDAYVILAKFFAATERPEEGLEVIQEALKINPEYFEALPIKAALQQKLGQLNEAVATYREIIKRSPDVTAYLKMAEILIRQNKHGDALNILHRAMKFRSQLPQIFLLLGEPTLKSNQTAKAYFIYSRLQQLGNRDPRVQAAVQQARQIMLMRRQSVRSIAS